MDHLEADEKGVPNPGRSAVRAGPPESRMDAALSGVEPSGLHGPQTRLVVERLVRRINPHHSWHQDLVQEALIHWWKQERRWPGHNSGWYLRSCAFFLRNLLREGRSVDSLKRCHGCGKVPLSHLESPNGMHLAGSVAPLMEILMVRDIVSLLIPSLTPVEQKVLACLLDGRGARETARHLHLSHTCVVKKRRRIAALVLQLDQDARNGFQSSRRIT